MKRSIIAGISAFGVVAGYGQTSIDGRSGTGRMSWDLLAFLLVGIVVYMVLSRLISRLSRGKPWAEGDSFDLVSRRAVRRRRHVHRHRAQLHFDEGEKPKP